MIHPKTLVSLHASPLNEDYLSYVFLEFANQDYFSVAFSEYEKDTAIYIEYSSQSQSIRSNAIDYILLENYVIFSFNDTIAKALNYDKNALLIRFYLNEEDYNLLHKSLKTVFKKIENE